MDLRFQKIAVVNEWDDVDGKKLKIRLMIRAQLTLQHFLEAVQADYTRLTKQKYLKAEKEDSKPNYQIS